MYLLLQKQHTMFKPKLKNMTLFLRIMTRGTIAGITLSPFGIYLHEKYYLQLPGQRIKKQTSNEQRKLEKLINHEKIHWQQQLEMLIIFFYIWYLIEWFLILFGKGNAYRNISFERESKINEIDLTYLEKRKPYAWVKYLKKPKK